MNTETCSHCDLDLEACECYCDTCDEQRDSCLCDVFLEPEPEPDDEDDE